MKGLLDILTLDIQKHDTYTNANIIKGSSRKSPQSPKTLNHNTRYKKYIDTKWRKMG